MNSFHKKSVSIVFLFVILSLSVSFGQIERWVYTCDGPGHLTDQAYSIVYGLDNDIYAAGYTTDSSFLPNLTVISLARTGDTNWVYKQNCGSIQGWSEARSVVYGSDNNLYAAGYIYNRVNHNRDFAVVSLTTAGDTNWTYSYNGPGNDMDVANSIICGTDGNIYAAGFTNTGIPYADFTVMSLTTTGDTNWIYKYDGPGGASDEVRSITYGSDNNLYAAGYSRGINTGKDVTVISLTTAGDTNWVYRYDGFENEHDEAYSITYGLDGNIYAAGYSRGFSNYYVFVVIKLDSLGNEEWIFQYDGGAAGSHLARSIIYGLDGNIYAAGYSWGNSVNADFVVISLTTAGDTNWVYRYNGPEDSWDDAYSIVYGLDGNIYAAGYSRGINTGMDVTVISLTTTGDTNWIYRHNGPGNFTDLARSLVYGADGNIYIAGYTYGGHSTREDFTVISLAPETRIEEESITVTKINYGVTIISGHLHLPEGKKCKVFDVTGRVVESSKIQPGIYFIEIDGVVTQKVVKVR